MARLVVVLAAMVSLFFDGCAAASTRSLTSGGGPVSVDKGLEGTISAGPSSFLQSEPFDVLFLVHLEYERPPYSLTLRVKDTQGQFETLEIRSVQIRYEAETAQTITPHQRIGRFEDRSGSQEFFVELPNALPRHAPVEVIITADAIRRDGGRVSVEFTETFSPSSRDWIAPYYSWVASV